MNAPFTIRHSPFTIRLTLLTLLLLAFALRVYRLDFQELRGDEAFGYFFSQRDYGDIVGATIALKEPHPVASYFVQKSWLALAGDGEFALRFPGAWWGVLAVALLYRLARRLGFGRWPAALAMFLLALSPYAIWHSQDARMYAMSLALTTAAVLFGVEALQRQRNVWATAYVVTAWLALHTHYYAFYVLLALNLFVVGRAVAVPRTRAVLQPWLLWNGIVAALYLPWFYRAGGILADYGGNGDSPGLPEALQRAFAVLAVGETIPPDQRLGWALVAALLVALGGVRLALGGADERRTLGLLLLYLGVPLLATWSGAQARPIFNERYLVALLPPFFLLMAAAFAGRRFPRPWGAVVNAGAGLLAVVLVAGMVLALGRLYLDPVYSKTRGWRELAPAFDRLAAGLPVEKVRIAQNFPDPTLWYYYRGPVAHVVLPPAAGDAAGTRREVEALAAAGIQRVILPVQPAANWDGTGLAAAALEGRFDRLGQTQVGVWPVQFFGLPGTALSAVDAAFANGVTLAGAAYAPVQLAPGGLLAVHLDWRGAEAKLTGTEKVFVQLLDAGGQLVAQDDRPLLLTGPRAAGSGLAAYGLPLPAELAAGPYRLIAGLYDPGQTGAPRVPTAGGADQVLLAAFE